MQPEASFLRGPRGPSGVIARLFVFAVRINSRNATAPPRLVEPRIVPYPICVRRLRQPLGILMAAQQHRDVAVTSQIEQKRYVLMPKQEDGPAQEFRMSWIHRLLIEHRLKIKRPHPLSRDIGDCQASQSHDEVVRDPHNASHGLQAVSPSSLVLGPSLLWLVIELEVLPSQFLPPHGGMTQN